jgi:hypothetical protein
MQSIGFKEWALVCEALGTGRQRVIIRKGGIAEGRNGFAFRHQDFFLFPTFFHEQLGRVRESNGVLPRQLDGEIEIRFFARIKETRAITNWEEARALQPLHILQESVVRERFDSDRAPGVHVAFVDVFRLNPIWRFPDSNRYGGCRSWVNLPTLPEKFRLESVTLE